MNMMRPITVARYFPLMSEISDDFVKNLKEKEVVLDIRKDLVTFAVEHAGYLSFNKRLGLLENPNGEINNHFSEVFKLFGQGLFQIPLFNYFRTPSYKTFEKHTDALHKLVRTEVSAAMKKLDKLKSTGQFDPDKDPHLLHQLLSEPHMVKSGQAGLTIFGLFTAGGETTASSLTFILYELAKNKRVQEKLYQEIEKNLPEDKVLTEAALKKMSYLKACLKESMRYTFPLPGGVERKLTEDVVVKEYLLPKGTVVSMNQNFVVTRNPDIFEDPDEFKPERWLRNTTDRQKSVHPHALLPFGIGPRSCIGRRFAEMEMHTCIAKSTWIINDLFKKYGPIFKQGMRNKTVIFLSDPADFELVSKAEGAMPFRSPLLMFTTYSKRRNLPIGLGSLRGEEWLNVRRPAQQNMLRPITVARYFPLMSEISDDFVEIMREKEVVSNIRKELMTFAIENAGYLGFNRRLGLLENPNGELNNHFNEVFRLFNEGLYQLPWYLLFRTSTYKKFEEHNDALHKLVDSEVSAAKERLNELKSTGQFDVDEDPHLLHQLLSDPQMVKNNQVGQTIFGLFLGGGETTSSTLTFLLYELAKNKRVQDKLYQEIDKNLPDDKVLTEAALKKMSYLKACLKESMRYTFPLPIGIERTLAEDIVVKDYQLPKGTSVSMVQNVVVTRNPDIFEDPNEFKPERWLRNTDERQKSVHSHALLPFGIGPRSCIGRRFAEMEIHTCLAKIIQHLEVSLVDPGKQYDLIYKPFPDTTEPIALRFTKRKY
ncbi:hypothetical protein FSP39_007860 [Pinctada imbricata]|uniref:Cytochrome P450 n=1 Tax=Pinctada imbricata TaxID=66713 RepID=A0AA88YHW4_PINIB|nr:hypothetical protein FSP39_007860 [Pinctada imbricata]